MPSPCPSSLTHLCLILCPSLSLLIEILLSREDAPSPCHSSHDPVFYDSPLCGPCSFIQYVTSSCARLLYAVLGVSLPGEESGLPQPTSRDYSFTSAQWLSKSTCVLTVQVISPTLPCRAVCFLSRFRSHFPTRQAQLLLAYSSSWALGLDTAALVCPTSVSLGSNNPPLNVRFRPVPVLSNSDHGWMCWVTVYMVVTSLR